MRLYWSPTWLLLSTTLAVIETRTDEHFSQKEELNTISEPTFRTTASAKVDALLGGQISRRMGEIQHECGTVIGTATKDEVLTVTLKAVDLIFGDTTMGKIAKDALEATVKYGIEARKICSSCEEAHELYGTLLDDMSFGKYCGADKFGFNATLSGLLVLPVVPSTGSYPVGVLKGAVSHHWEETDSFHIPSETWPVSVLDFLGTSNNATEVYKTMFSNYNLLCGMAAGSSGAAVIWPDYIGYGESYDHPKSYGVKRSYQLSSVPLWLYAQHMIRNKTESCTILDHVGTCSGYSEGAFAAISTAEALADIGVKLLSVQAGGGPYKISSTQMLKTIERNDAGSNNPLYSFVLVLLGYAYSSTNPDVLNTNLNQDMLSDEYMDPTDPTKNAPKWVEDGFNKSVINSLIPENSLDVLNPKVISFFRESNSSSPCVTDTNNYTDKICEALIANDLTASLISVMYPVEFCHSPQDEVNDYDNVPDTTENTNLTEYSLLTVKGSHLEASETCLFAAMTPFVTLFGSAGEASKILNLTENRPECPLVQAGLPWVSFPTVIPTVMPTTSPVRAPASPASRPILQWLPPSVAYAMAAWSTVFFMM